MAELTIPAGPDDLTPEWLTRALGKTGAIAHSNIVDCRPERLGQGQGFVGQIYRFTLEYNVPDNSLPRTLVAKFSSPTGASDY